MLCLNLSPGEYMTIGENVVVQLDRISGDRCKLVVEAPREIPILRGEVLERQGVTAEAVDLFVFHQANARIIDLVAKKYGISPEKYYKNIQRYGNTSAASIPIALSELEEAGRLPAGTRAMLVGFGGGLTWGGALVEIA